MNKLILAALAAFFIVGGSAPALADCLVRPFKDGKGVDQTFKVIVPAAEAQDYAKLGFEPTSCGAVDVAAYRDKVCEFVTWGNSAVQNQLEVYLGAQPAKMCASAKLAARPLRP